MPDYIGRIAVPEIVPSGTFPIMPDYPHGRAWQPDVAIHQFGSGNAKIEQRFLLGTGARHFTIRKAHLRETDRVALRNFWEAKYGPYGAFTYNAPNDDGSGTTPYVCRFANEPLSWEMVADHVSTVGITLIEIPGTAPIHALTQTVTRFPTAALETALLDQAQQLIPLIKIQPLEPGYPAIYVSDRRCTVGSQLYLARLLAFEGIEQSMGGEADEATFTFGNADRVMRELANDVDLFRASIEFSLFHVGTGVKLDLWKGDIVNWSLDAGPEFKVTAADGLYELNLPYPTRKISRTCNKVFNDGLACPYASEGALDSGHFPNASAGACDKGYDTPNGCLAHGMKRRFGGVIVDPQGVRVKDNSTGVWGFGRSTLTSVSLVAESIYDQVVPEIYTNSYLLVNCKIAAGRDEGDFYEAMGIVGEGPIGAFGSGHKLDDQYHHGYPGTLGLRTVLGGDPAGATDFFSLDSAGDSTGGDWRKAFSGNSTFLDNFAAGTAFVVIRRSDAKGLQLSKAEEHSMQAWISQGLSGWVWTAPGVCSRQVLSNPIWIAVNALLRAHGLRFNDAATAAAIGEQFFDVNAAVAAAGVCNEVAESIIKPGTYETQFKFNGVIQEEKPLRDWLQEILMNCLGYYTFAFGKLKLGVRNNSSAAEAFTEGNILFRSLQLAPLKPTFNHITANFADSEFQYVNNSMTLYDIDHAKLMGGASPLFLKSSVNLCGTSSKSQVARLITARLREELGGITADEWKRARQVSFKTTVLALNVEPGMVCSMTHPDMPGGAGEFRVTGWKLNPDYSIEIQGRTTTDSMYDLVAGPKPADVAAEPVPEEILYDTGVPGLPNGTPALGDYGTFAIEGISVDPDATGNRNLAGAQEIALTLFYVDELTTDLWASLDADLDAVTDGPAAVNCTVNPGTSRTFKVGDFIVFNDEAQDAANPGRRSYECAQIVGPGNEGDVVATGQFLIQRQYPDETRAGYATFETLRCAHKAGIRFYKLDSKEFTFAAKAGAFRNPSVPPRVECTLPSACVVAAVLGVANHFGYSPWRTFGLAHHTEPFTPGMRTCAGGAYTFQVPGAQTVSSMPVIPMRVHDAASIRCMFGYVQKGTVDGSTSYIVKRTKNGGATWETLELMLIGQTNPAYKTTYDSLVLDGYGTPDTRRLLYKDFGIFLWDAIVASASPQTVQTGSFGAIKEGPAAGEFVHVGMGTANEEYVLLTVVEWANQTFTALFTKNHNAGERVRPTVWPTPVLQEGDDLAIEITYVASPDPGYDLTVVIQT